MLVTAIMPLLAAHRFFLVSVHASAAKRVRLRDAVRRVAAASMAGMVLRALRPAGDDKEPRSQLFGAAKTPHLFAPEQTQRVGVVLVEQRLRAAKIRSPYEQTRL